MNKNNECMIPTKDILLFASVSSDVRLDFQSPVNSSLIDFRLVLHCQFKLILAE